MLWPKGQCVCVGGGGAKAVRHDRNFCNFFNLNNLPFLIKPSCI